MMTDGKIQRQAMGRDPLTRSCHQSTGDRPIHVLHLINDLDDGGAQTMLCKLLEHRADDRIEHGVVTLLDGGLNRDRVLDAGVPLQQLGFARGKAGSGAWLKLAKTLRRRRPCVIQAWLYHANLAAVTTRLPIDRSTVTLWNIRHSLSDIQQEKRLTRYVIRANGFLSRLPKTIVYCSRTSVQQHVDIGFSANNATVIPNGFDCAQFKPSADARHRLCDMAGIDPKNKIIGMAARYHIMKDHALLLNAVAQLRAKGHGVHLVLAGKEVDRSNSDIDQLIAALDLGDHVTLLGYRRDMPELIAGFDVYAMSSRWGEGFPNALGEAMASGVPCAATDVGDSRWIIGDTGRVVPPGDVRAFADDALLPLLTLSSSERIKLATAARARIIENFSIAAIAAQYENLYATVGQPIAAEAA